MKIQILGPGCSRCHQLEANTREALRLLGITEPVEKVSDPRRIAQFGSFVTPALAIDGHVVLSGKVAGPPEIQTAITSVL